MLLNIANDEFIQRSNQLVFSTHLTLNSQSDIITQARRIWGRGIYPSWRLFSLKLKKPNARNGGLWHRNRPGESARAGRELFRQRLLWVEEHDGDGKVRCTRLTQLSWNALSNGPRTIHTWSEIIAVHLTRLCLTSRKQLRNTPS